MKKKNHKEGGQLTEAQKELVKKHIEEARTIAKRRAQRLPPQAEKEELTSVAMEGLVQATTKYEAREGIPFMAYGNTVIEGAVISHMRREARRLGRQVDMDTAALHGRAGETEEERREVIRACRNLGEIAPEVLTQQQLHVFQRRMDGVTNKQIAAELGVKEEAVRQLLARGFRAIREFLKEKGISSISDLANRT